MERSTEPGEGLPLVIGLGNAHRRDDRAGLEVLRRLKDLLPGKARFLEGPEDFTALLDLWAGAKRVVVVDAVSSGADPGTIHRIVVGPEGLPGTLHLTSTHGGSLTEAVGLGYALGRMPDSLVVYGIEAEDLRVADGLSPRVEAALPRATERIVEELRGPGPSRTGGGPPHA